MEKQSSGKKGEKDLEEMRGYTTARPCGCGSVSGRQKPLELDYVRISNDPSEFVVASGVWRMRAIVQKET